MIKRISFKNYKLFKKWQHLELKPMTILIGKNSSGKSSVAKLPTLIEGSLSGSFPEPFQFSSNTNGVRLGDELKDLVYGRKYGSIEFEIDDSPKEQPNTNILKVQVSIDGSEILERAFIIDWQYYIHHYSLDTSSNSYLNENTKEFEANVGFRGFRKYNKDNGNNGTIDFNSTSLQTDYLGPFRAFPFPLYEIPKQTLDVPKMGIDGRIAHSILIADALTTLKQLFSKVNSWYEKNFEGWGIHINSDKRPYAEIEIVQKSKDLHINLCDVGQGMSQVLPLVVRAFLPDEKDTLIIIEEPELHLHPAAHGNLAELFAQSTIDNPHKHYLIETHSQNFVLRLRRMIAEQRFNKENLAIYYVDFDEALAESSLKRINVDDWGQVDFWPKNVFNETLEETSAIRNSQLNRREL